MQEALEAPPPRADPAETAVLLQEDMEVDGLIEASGLMGEAAKKLRDGFNQVEGRRVRRRGVGGQPVVRDGTQLG